MSSVKESALELIQRLPEECTWDDVMYQMYVRQKIEAGLDDLDHGCSTPHEDVFEEFNE
jgi:predicted transcriptional regulator